MKKTNLNTLSTRDLFRVYYGMLRNHLHSGGDYYDMGAYGVIDWVYGAAYNAVILGNGLDYDLLELPIPELRR